MLGAQVEGVQGRGAGGVHGPHGTVRGKQARDGGPDRVRSLGATRTGVGESGLQQTAQPRAVASALGRGHLPVSEVLYDAVEKNALDKRLASAGPGTHDADGPGAGLHAYAGDGLAGAVAQPANLERLVVGGRAVVVVDEAGHSGVSAVRCPAVIRVKVRQPVAETGSAEGFPGMVEEVPEGVGVTRSGQPHADADDGDRVGLGRDGGAHEAATPAADGIARGSASRWSAMSSRFWRRTGSALSEASRP